MKSAGVSFTAAASPIPAPAQRSRPAASSRQSARTRASSTRFTWPKLKVSRSGSKRASAHRASDHRYQPWRRHPGPARIRSTTASAARLTSREAAIAAGLPSAASGSRARAANGG
ncbi:hypothetical protein B446_05120 [Streptomyces collinus Tu 365]|uniref:Uncharacterized protein n=1 Tax=Streptomyces collinus (strain DSM 40733 / Tue 365) TaxID=1214242 RepID=S5VHC0_STRC3|nr:hypothetical protein B446_05120 [Streptomyces collinus Tu 365]